MTSTDEFQRVHPPARVPQRNERWQVAANQTLAQSHRALEFPRERVISPVEAPRELPLESTRMLLVKHLAQLGVIAAVVSFLIRGDSAPQVSLAYAALSLTFLFAVALVDRRRFEDADPQPMGARVVDVVHPLQDARPSITQQPWLMADLLVQQQLAAVAPLQQFLQAELTHLEVT